MVCTANDLQEWKDFPKGLKVLLLQEDNTSASEIRTKLEAMDYNGKRLFGFFLFVLFCCVTLLHPHEILI
jgi:hypothetical protein